MIECKNIQLKILEINDADFFNHLSIAELEHCDNCKECSNIKNDALMLQSIKHAINNANINPSNLLDQKIMDIARAGIALKNKKIHVFYKFLLPLTSAAAVIAIFSSIIFYSETSYKTKLLAQNNYFWDNYDINQEIVEINNQFAINNSDLVDVNIKDDISVMMTLGGSDEDLSDSYLDTANKLTETNF